MKKTLLILTICTALALFFNFYKQSQVPACINADEAAFGYNAFSILKTLKDEHGIFLPLRLLSFNDMKLPFYSYLSIPFISVFGLNDISVRLLNKMAGILLVPLSYLFVYELFRNKKIAYVAAFLTSVSPWIYILSRHVHEAVLSLMWITMGLWLLCRFFRTQKKRDVFLSLSAIFLATFSYHTARLYLVFVAGCVGYLLLKKLRESKSHFVQYIPALIFLVIILFTPFLVDLRYGVNRVNKLFFTSNIGFQLRLDEYLRENPNRIFHNKLTQFVREGTVRYFAQISPDFFVNNGDANPRFGMGWLGPITPVEYIFIGVGLYFLIKKKQKNGSFIILLLLISPLSNSLTWAEPSLTRIFPMIIPILAIVSFGVVSFVESLAHYSQVKKLAITLPIIFAFLFYNINNHDLYFNHYFSRALNIRSWQCGYKELADYIRTEYDSTDTFYITKNNGQPYIYLLFYLKYDPEKFHSSAKRTAADEYGFSQVESFDKFHFELPSGPAMPKNATFIGFPDEFEGREYDAKKIKKIIYGPEQIFWIYKN